jgi:hypothetical protein
MFANSWISSAHLGIGALTRAAKIRSGFCLATLCLAAVFAAGQAETGQIVGTVTDQSAAAIPQAKVTIKSASTGLERSQNTDANGNFVFTNLLPAAYDVSAGATGFASFKQRTVVAVGAKVGLDLKLKVGAVSTTMEVTESASMTVNVETQTLSQVLETENLTELPTITRNPYDLVRTAGTVSEDDPSASMNRGVGVAINGLRAAGTNVLLDGVANNDEFIAGVGQKVPLDAVQEIGIITNNFTAEYGRADAGVINVTTKSGTNDIHGTAYEFNRVSALASNSFNDDANGLPKSPYTYNQFGYSVGGPIIKNKLFFFDSTEWTRIRSTANLQALVPDPALIASAAGGTQAAFAQYGKLASNTSVLQKLDRNDLTALGGDPCGGETSGGCASYNPTSPMFDLVNYSVPNNAGAGSPQNAYSTVGRVDYNLNQSTQLYTRYALYSENDFNGTVSNSPYAGFNTGETIFNNSLIVSLTHTFSPRFISQSKLDFNRFNNLEPLSTTGVVPNYYLGSAESTTSIGPYQVALPGYGPYNPATSIPFGGPQNFGQAYQDFSFTKGKHEFRFGGSFNYLRDNRTFGAYEEGQQIFGHTIAQGMDNLLAGQLYEFDAAVYPQGKFPCIDGAQTPACTVNLPLGPPLFERSDRYREGATYFQDSWKIARTLTVNLGLRWEYFGVQHNVNPNLDSNFYPANVANPYEAIAQGVVDTAPTSPIGELWTPSQKNFAPRVGIAWDVFGDGKTSLRAGYGIGYERNFGNITFNVMFNPPNYAVVDLIAGSNINSIPISNANFGPFSGSSGSTALPPSELRAVQPNIPQAYAHLMSAALEHQFGQHMHLEVDYSGSIGENLYDIAATNFPGTGNYYLGVPCTPGDTLSGGPNPCEAPLNNQYAGINRRGAAGYSDYNAMNIRYDIQDIHHSGLTLRTNYTWSHALDDLSDTFSTSSNQFNLGYTDPFVPSVDYGNAEFDNRQRVALSAIWDVPFARNMHGLAGKFLDGWELAPILTARTGAPYTVYDLTNNVYVYPRVAASQLIPVNSNLPGRPSGGTNTFDLLDFSKIKVDESYLNPITGDSDFGPWPSDTTGRDYFHAPGNWNLDLGLYKNTRLTEKATLQLRLEAYDAFNHANFYVNTGSAYVISGQGIITGSYGFQNGTPVNTPAPNNRNIQIGAKFIF